MNEKLLSLRQVENIISYGETKIRQWVSDKKFPAPIRAHGNGDCRWLESEVQEWIAEQVKQNREAA